MTITNQKLKNDIDKLLPSKRGGPDHLELQSFKDSIRLHITSVIQRIWNRKDKLSYEFSASGGIVQDWTSIQQELSHLSFTVNFKAVITEKMNSSIHKKELKSFILSKSSELEKILKDNITESIQTNSNCNKAAEITNITNKIGEDVIYNLTNNPNIPAQLKMDFISGGKFIPVTNNNDANLPGFVYKQISESLTKMYGHLKSRITPTHLKTDIQKLTLHPKITGIDKTFLLNIVEKMDSVIPLIKINKNEYTACLGDLKHIKNGTNSDLIILQCDKNIGLCILTKDQVMDIYKTCNSENGYIKSKFTNEGEYIREFTSTRNTLIPAIPTSIATKLSLKLLTAFYTNTGSIGILRPLPKLHKLPEPIYLFKFPPFKITSHQGQLQ